MPRCQQGLIAYRGSRGESITSPFLASRGRLHSLAHGPFLHLQAHSGWSGLFPVMSPWHGSCRHIWFQLFHLPPSLRTKHPYDHTGPAWIIQDHLCISQSLTESPLQNPLCHVKEHITGSRGQDVDIFGKHCSAYRMGIAGGNVEFWTQLSSKPGYQC